MLLINIFNKFPVNFSVQTLEKIQNNGIPLWGNIIIYSFSGLFFFFGIISVVFILKTDFTAEANQKRLQKINLLVGLTVLFMLAHLISLIILVSYYFV